MAATPVDTAGGARVQLQFSAKRGVTYEVHRRQTLEEAGTPVAFSLTADGPASETTFTPTRTATAALFVDRGNETEFFSVSILVSEA